MLVLSLQPLHSVIGTRRPMIELFKPLAHDNIPEIDLVMQIWKAELKERLQIVIQKLFPGAIEIAHPETPSVSEVDSRSSQVL